MSCAYNNVRLFTLLSESICKYEICGNNKLDTMLHCLVFFCSVFRSCLQSVFLSSSSTSIWTGINFLQSSSVFVSFLFPFLKYEQSWLRSVFFILLWPLLQVSPAGKRLSTEWWGVITHRWICGPAPDRTLLSLLQWYKEPEANIYNFFILFGFFLHFGNRCQPKRIDLQLQPPSVYTTPCEL